MRDLGRWGMGWLFMLNRCRRLMHSLLLRLDGLFMLNRSRSLMHDLLLLGLDGLFMLNRNRSLMNDFRRGGLRLGMINGRRFRFIGRCRLRLDRLACEGCGRRLVFHVWIVHARAGRDLG